MECTRDERGSWRFNFSGEEIRAHLDPASLGETVARTAASTPPQEVLQLVLGAIERALRSSVDSLISTLDVLPSPSLEELHAAGLAEGDLDHLTSAQEESLKARTRIVALEVQVSPSDVMADGDAKPFYNATVEDPWGRFWSVGDDYVDY